MVFQRNVTQNEILDVFSKVVPLSEQCCRVKCLLKRVFLIVSGLSPLLLHKMVLARLAGPRKWSYFHYRNSMCVVSSGLRLTLVMAALAMEDVASGKDAIAEGLLDLLKPSVQQLDLHVHSMR